MIRSQNCPYPPDFPPSPLPLSALSVNSVLRKTRSLTQTDPQGPLTSPRCPSPLFLARVRNNIIPWDLRFLCFHTLTHSFVTSKTPSPSFSGVSALFGKYIRVRVPLCRKGSTDSFPLPASIRCADATLSRAPLSVQPVTSHESPATASITSTLLPSNYGIIPPHRGTIRNPICARGGFSD
jgi:hypothetical protein